MDEVAEEVRNCLSCDNLDDKWSEGYREGYKDGHSMMNWVHEDIASYAKTGHGKRESWDLGSHILRDLEYNIPIMLKNLHGTPSSISIEICEKKYPNLNADYYGRLTTEESDLIHQEADELWKKMLEECLLNARLYIYYAGEMPRDDDPLTTPDDIKFWQAFDKEWKSSIPKTSNGCTDWVKLTELEDQCWERVWDFVKKYGRSLWD